MAGNENAREGLAIARKAYLFGYGNGGTPVRNRKTLLELSTVHSDTLAKHIVKWEAEAEEIARSAGENSLGFVLREETIMAHREDVEFLRRQCDSLKSECDNIDEIQLELYQLVQSIGDNLTLTAEDFDSVSKVLERYLAHSANRKAVLNLFLATQKRWQDSSAVSSTIAAYETTLKEHAKRKAKQEGEKEGVNPDDMKRANAGQAAAGNTGLFRR
jgi:hypothetical protein